MSTNAFYVCSPRMTRLVLDGVEEILGAPALGELLPQVRSANGEPGGFAQLRAVLEQRYNAEAAGGVLLRAGRAMFTGILKSYAAEVGYEDMNYRLLAPRKRVLQGLALLADFLTRECGSKIHVSSQEGFWRWSAEACLECYGLSREKPACCFTQGMLQEFMLWVSSGRIHLLREGECGGTGGTCVIEIEQHALD